MNRALSSMRSTRPHDRRGLSLVEVIVALAILAAVASVVSQMVDIATRRAFRAAELQEARVVANNLLAEIASGLRPAEVSTRAQPVDMWSLWEYQLEVEPITMGDLYAVTILVSRRTDASATGMGEATGEFGPVQRPVAPAPTNIATDRGGRRASEPTQPVYRWTQWMTLRDREDGATVNTTRESLP